MEGHASPPFVDIRRADEPPDDSRKMDAVDARQDALMAEDSVDGRPPSHRQRMTGWRWVAIVMPVLVLGGAAWALIEGVSGWVLLGAGVVLLPLLVVGGWPVWIAGLRRGEEETIAREEASDDPHA